jgi:hypothetical protein
MHLRCLYMQLCIDHVLSALAVGSGAHLASYEAAAGRLLSEMAGTRVSSQVARAIRPPFCHGRAENCKADKRTASGSKYRGTVWTSMTSVRAGNVH